MSKPNATYLIIDSNGTYIDTIKGVIVGNNANSNPIYIISPFPATDSVSINYYLRNAMITNYTQYLKIFKDNNGNNITGKDVLDSSLSYYQTVKDWYVWNCNIGTKALRAISKYHAGIVDVSITIREFKNLDIENTGTYLGTFGSTKSTTGGDLPDISNEGDYYKCDYLDYTSPSTGLEFTLLDLAIINNGEWIKGEAYEERFTSASTPISVDPSVYGQAIEDIEPNTTELVLGRVSDMEARIISTLPDPEGYFNEQVVRTNLDLVYDNRIPEDTDIVYIEDDLDNKYYSNVGDLTKNRNEISGDIIHTTSVTGPTTGTGFYADENNILIGSATGSGITWDGTNLYLRGTLQAAAITDPDLIAEITGPQGPEGQQGPQGDIGPQGETGATGANGISFKFLGFLPSSSYLSSVIDPEVNDAYRMTDTSELYIYNGSSWDNMGVLQGESAKYVKVTGKQSFKYLEGKTIPTETSIILTASLYGDLTTYQWQYWTGSQWLILSGDYQNSTYILNYNAIEWGTSTSLRIRCNSSGVYDEITIVKLYDGKNAITGYLTNENETVPTLSDGTGYDLSNSGGTFKLYDGIYDKVADTSFSVTVSTKNGLTLVIDSDGVYTLSGSSWTTDVETFELNALYNGFTVSKKFTISKSKQGNKGDNGLDGTDGQDGINSYLHIAYATSSDGSTGFSLTYTGVETYMGTYTDSILADSTDYTDYEWVKIQGPKGDTGDPGTDGINGTSAYLHIAYANSSDGSVDFTTTYTGSEIYIGTYTDSNPTDSTNYLDYDWFKAVGTDGSDGINGDPAYFHIAYATSSDGSTGFSLTYTGVETYMGTYVDTNVTDSTNPLSYEWVLFKGTDGTDGTDGTSVVLKGSVATTGDLPTSGNTIGDLYVVLADGDGYVWNGSSWDNVGQIQGPKGDQGDPGLNAYIHYAYATSSNGSTGFSLTYTGVETYIGWYTDFTLADSTDYTDYDWSLFKGADGADGQDGADGTSVYVHYAYATSSDGSTGFSLTYTGIEYYIGILTDNTLADSTNYLDYEWSLFRGSDGLNGQDGTNGLSAYLHYAYATSSDGSTGFTTTYTGVETYVGIYTDFTQADSTDYNDYEWALFKGADGQDGTNGTNGVDGEDAKYVVITGENIFHYLSDQDIPENTSITLTAFLTNLTGYSWQYWTGSQWADLSGTNTSQNYTLTYDSQDWINNYQILIRCISEGVYSTVTVYKVYDGNTGQDGPQGPGLVFRGTYNSSSTYYSNASRRDVVLYNSQYYACINETTGTWNSSNWEIMASFASVATDILLTQNATITKGLVMGDGSNNGFIRSYGMSSLTSGNGFYLSGNDGKLRLGNVSGDNIYWNGSSLNITGDLTATNLTINNDTTITHALIMGDYYTKGSIRSYGMTSLTDTNGGFYLNGDGKFIFGKYGDKRIEWTGSNLNVVDDLIKVELLSLDISSNNVYATATYRIYNFTNRTKFCSVKKTSNYDNSTQYYAGLAYISANDYSDSTVTYLYYDNSYVLDFKLSETGYTDITTSTTLNIPHKEYTDYDIIDNSSYHISAVATYKSAPVYGDTYFGGTGKSNQIADFNFIIQYKTGQSTDILNIQLPDNISTCYSVNATPIRTNYDGSGVDQNYAFFAPAGSSDDYPVNTLVVVKDYASSSYSDLASISIKCYVEN